MSLLQDITSQDPQRIWSSACAIRKLREPRELSLLAAHLDEIKVSTNNVPLGGALRPNVSHLTFAIRKLEFVRDSTQCLCALYLLDDLYNPLEEEQAGNVSVLDTTSNAEEWTTIYECQCRVCSAGYRVVEEQGGHYPTWAWQLVSNGKHV